MASDGAKEGDGCMPLDTDYMRKLLQVEHEQIQRRTFTNWINAQLAKRCPPSFTSNLFSDLRDGSLLLDLLEVLSGQQLKRQSGHGLFQHRTNIETALNFLKKKSVKLVNINISDIIDGRPSIILGLVWTVILRCHIEELASTLSFTSCHSSLESLASSDSWSRSPVPSLPDSSCMSPIHRRFRISAKKSLLMWVRVQCQRVGCSVSVRDFKASWRSGEVFLAILCSLRPQLVDYARIPERSNRDNLEEAFHLAEKELHIPRLLDPQDVDVQDPDEKSIMTYVAQFLQYSNDTPGSEEHEQLFPSPQSTCFLPVTLSASSTPVMAVSPLHQASPSERAQDVRCWLQQAYQELSETWAAMDKSSYAEKYQVFESFVDSFGEKRRPVMTLLAAVRRCPELTQEQQALKSAWDCLQEELQRCKADLELSLPPPLVSVLTWARCAEAALAADGETGENHAAAAKKARSQQDALKAVCREMSHQTNVLDTFQNSDDSGNVIVPHEKLAEIKRQFTHIRVTAKYQGIKLEYRECHHTLLDLLGSISAKVRSWRAPYASQEIACQHLHDWHEAVENQSLLLILMDTLQSLKEKAAAYTSKAALAEDSQLISCQVREAEREAALVMQDVTAARESMEKAVSAWETYNGCLTSLHTWLAEQTQATTGETADVSVLASCQAQLNKAGNLLIEVMEPAASFALTRQLSQVNMRWAEHMKRTVFDIPPAPSAGPPQHQMANSLVQEASCLLRHPPEVASSPLRAHSLKLKSLSKKMLEVDVSSNSLYPEKEIFIILQEMLAGAERTCEDLQPAAARLEARLAELDRWNREALDCYHHLKEKEQGGLSPQEPFTQHLISGGLQLQNQVLVEGRNLQDLAERLQKTSPFQYLSATGLQGRISKTVSHCKEILEMFCLLGLRHVVEAPGERLPLEMIRPGEKRTQKGTPVAARTKHVDEVGRVNRQKPAHFVTANFVSPQSVKSEKTEVSIAFQRQDSVEAKSPKIPPPSTSMICGIQENVEDTSKARTFRYKPGKGEQQRTLQSATTSPVPPLLDASEVYSKAQLMARSRLGKARFRLQERIQQAMELSGTKEISEVLRSKKEQRALRILQPAIFEEFLVALNGFRAFCSGPLLQDLTILSDSLRKQWEALATGTPPIAEALKDMYETLWLQKSLCPLTGQQQEVNEANQSSRGLEFQANPPGRKTLTPSKQDLRVKQTHDGTKQAPSCVADTASRHDAPQLEGQDVLPKSRRQKMTNQDPAGAREKPTVQDREQPVKARLLCSTEGAQQRQAHILTVVKCDAVEIKQEVEWTVIPETGDPSQATLSSDQEVPESGASVKKLMVGTADRTALIAENLDRIIREPVEVSSLTLEHSGLIADLKEISDDLQSEMKNLSEQSGEEEKPGPDATSVSSPSQAHHSGHCPLVHLRERLERVQAAARSLDGFLAAAREVKAETLQPPPNRVPGGRQNEAERELERLSWLTVARRRLRTALQQSEYADGALKAAGVTLSAGGGGAVRCWDLATSLSQEVADMENEMISVRVGEDNQRMKMTERGEKRPIGTFLSEMKVDSQPGDPTYEKPLIGMEEESEPRAKRRAEDNSKTQREEDLKAHTWLSEGDAMVAMHLRGMGSHVKSERIKGNSARRRLALIGALTEIQRAAEQLCLQEATLPALHQRKHALTELESQLADHLYELQNIGGNPDELQSGEVEAGEEARKAVTKRLDQCGELTELLKRFQSTFSEMSRALQRAERSISEKASYMGRDNLLQRHTEMQKTKAELSGLGAGVEQVRSIGRQLLSHFRRIPVCAVIPFEGEADALMDRWLDISERVECHAETLHLGLSLWDGALQLGCEVNSSVNSKLAKFAQSPSLQSEENIEFLQNEISAQEENMERFQRKSSEIQALLQSAEPPLELQVLQTQTRKKIEQLRQLLSDKEDTSRIMLAPQDRITDRTTECCRSLQRIQESLLMLRGSDTRGILTKLQDLYAEMQTQEQLAESLMQVLRSPEDPHKLSADRLQLQREVRATRQKFSETEAITETYIQELSGLQESEPSEQRVTAAEETVAKKKNLVLLHEEAPQLSALVEESVKTVESYCSIQSSVLGGCMEARGRKAEDSRSEEQRRLARSSPGGAQRIQSPGEQRRRRDKTGDAVMEEGEKTEDEADVESKGIMILKILGKTSPEKEKKEGEAATEGQEGRIQGAAEPGGMAESSAPDGGSGGSTCESPGPGTRKHRFTMRDVLSEIQSLVERSNIINRTPHVDLHRYLQSSPGETEIRLQRTVQKVLACRYQPARLDVTAMGKQLEEAEDLQRSVLDQVAVSNNNSSSKVGDSNAVEGIEEQRSTALLHASVTVQVKATQLDQVRKYHEQMKVTKAFLDVLASEKEKMSLNSLGSSTLQAEKLRGLLLTMERKEDMLQELLGLSSQVSVHLSDAESSGALLAKLGDVLDEWRLLEGSIKRALRQASNSASQSSILIKEAKDLKGKIEAIQESIKSCGTTLDKKKTLELVCLTTNLKLYKQLYLHLQSQSDALVHFSLGQRENDEVKLNLQELESLLKSTQEQLESSTSSAGGFSSAKIYKRFQDLIIRAKQAENHFSIGKKLSLFPEEARLQIAEMKTFQTDILTRRTKIRAELEEMKALASDMDDEDHDQVLRTVEVLYDTITESLNRVLDTMKKNLQQREKLLGRLAEADAWLAEMHAQRDPCTHVENVSTADTGKLESELKIHQLATFEIEKQLSFVKEMEQRSKETAVGLSPGESRYIVNRVSGLWTELDGLLAHEKATSWELEELIHERTSSDEELSGIQGSLKQISSQLERQSFPLRRESLSKLTLLKHMLMEHQCQVQEIQHCQEAKRSALLCTIGELQDRCKALSIHAFEQDKYLHLREQMNDSRDVARRQIRSAREETLGADERFRLHQALLVELPLVKTQCQEAADQLEVIAPELYPSELNSERQSIRRTVETLISWEQSVTDDIKTLEAELLPGMRFSSEFPTLVEFLQSARQELRNAEPVGPDEKAVDIALQRCWVIWRNMESRIRVLRALGVKEKKDMKIYSELQSLEDAVMHECHSHMESLSKARESLKDYQWAAQGAIGFLLNAEATFLSGGFPDCTEEQRQTQQAIKALEDGFQAHICHLAELVPRETRLSPPKTQQLHIGVLSRLLVGRAMLEAQAQLRLECLQSCEIRQKSHKRRHEDIQQQLSGFEAKLSECAAEHVTSYDKGVSQHKRAKLLLKDLHSLARRIEELRAGCPVNGCGVGKDGELGALWRRWASLRRGVGLLMAHTEQRGEEWRDITTSMEQCCSTLANLQAEVPDSSTVSFSQEEPHRLLARAEMHKAGIEQEQQDLASLEHRLEHALSLTSSQDPIGPGPMGKTLVKIQENIRSLKERNLQLVAAAHAEEKERQQVEERLREVEQWLAAILPKSEASLGPHEQQALREDLQSQRAKLHHIMEDVQSRYAEIPADIHKWIHEIQQSLQEAEVKLQEISCPFQKLARQVGELNTGLKNVKGLLQQRSSTVTEAQDILKRVWDEMDGWHSRLMLLECEVQDLAEEQPVRAHIFMDHLTQPLQLYQKTAQMAEHRTNFLNKLPVCLQELENILCSSACWLDEARAWLGAACDFTTARSLQNQAKSLQMVLGDSERIRDTLQAFRPVLAEISAVCDVSVQEEQLEQNDERVHATQCDITESLELLLQAAAAVEALETELKTVQNNVSKIRVILSSAETSSLTFKEHLHSREVILDNIQSMRETLEEMDACKGRLCLPQGAKENLQVFCKCRPLLLELKELEQLTHQEATFLEDKIREERGATEDHGTKKSLSRSEVMMERGGYPQRHLTLEALVECNSEEEVEDNRSCHSSSSETLTSSIPEDPEDTLNSSDLKFEDMAEMNPLSDLKSPRTNGSSVAQKCYEGADHQVLQEDIDKMFEHENVGISSTTLEPKSNPEADSVEEDRLIASVAAPPITPAISAPADEVTAAPDPPVSQNRDPQQPGTTMEDTRLIPARPVAPFTASTAEIRVKKDKGLCLSGEFHREEDQREVMEESRQVTQALISPGGLGGFDAEQQQRWNRLHEQISLKLSTLKKAQDENQTPASSGGGGTGETGPEGGLILPGSASAVLPHATEAIHMLRRIAWSADESNSSVREKLHSALQRVLLCLDAVTDLLLTPKVVGEDAAELRRLQHECVWNELVDLTHLLVNVEPKTRSLFQEKEPGALLCLTTFQQCLQTAQLVLTSSSDQFIEHPGLTNQHQGPFSHPLYVSVETGLEQDVSPCLTEASSLELCVPGSHQGESQEGEAILQKDSQSLLRGIRCLLELGEEYTMAGPVIQDRNQLNAILCGQKKLQRALGSQSAFARHLFRHRQEALKFQEDERLRLEKRVKAWRLEALESEVASQMRLQEWVRWEDDCARLSGTLDECETFIGRRDLEGEDDEDSAALQRLHIHQRTLAQLEEGRATLGRLLDRREAIQAEPMFPTSVGLTGGALELRWRSAYRRTEQEIRRCRTFLGGWDRFQTDSASVSQWLVDANGRLKTWSVLGDSADPDQECVHRNLIRLLDFSLEMGVMAAKRATVSQEANKLLGLRDADCPRLRARLVELEAGWSRLTFDLLRIQDQQQQKLLLRAWPPAKLLPDLEAWLGEQEALLTKERESVLKAKNASEITRTLQHYQASKVVLVNGQLLLEFLSQSGPQEPAAVTAALCSKRTVFAERLGAVRLQWLNLQRELESKICEAEKMHLMCATRERLLEGLRNSVEEQKKSQSRWRRLTSQTQARKDVLEWETVVGRVKEATESLQKLKSPREPGESGEARPCDTAFLGQAEKIRDACMDFSQELQSLKAPLQQAVEKWARLEINLKKASLNTTGLSCTLRYHRAPLFSVDQAEGYVDLLQQLEEKAAQEGELWSDIDESYLSLCKSLHEGTAKSLGDQLEGERTRWKDTSQEIKEERGKTGETLALWREHNRLADGASVRLKLLRRQWEELSGSCVSPCQDASAVTEAAQKLQDGAEDLQRTVADVLVSSKPLIGRQEPLIANLIQSATRILSRDVLLLSQLISATKTRIEEDGEQHDLFHAQLKNLESEMQSILGKQPESMDDKVALKLRLQELSDMFPSLLDVLDISGHLILAKQEAETLRTLRALWIESVARMSAVHRELQTESQRCQDFQQKCDDLTTILERLEQEPKSRKPGNYSKDFLSVFQKQQIEMITGQQLFRGLLCDAVESLEKQTGEKRSELMVQMASIQERWFRSISASAQRRALVEQLLRQQRIYRIGSKRLSKLLRDVAPLLPPPGLTLCTLQQLQCHTDTCQRVEEVLKQHSSIYTLTMEASRHLCEAVTEPESQSRLQSEILAVEEKWKYTTSLLQQWRVLISTTMQIWSKCQDGITNIMSVLDELKAEVKKPLPDRLERSEEAELIQKTGIPLQNSASRLKELATMKTELVQYITAGDSALLEQQLEQLHFQWEDLCVKVSLRRQEIADRLNAWTIFNDKNKEFCNWLTQMENKVCHTGDLSISEMVEKLKKECMEEINLFSENKSHLKQLGEQLLLASDEAKLTRVQGSLQEVHERWHNLFHQIEARVKKLKETLTTMQQLDKNMSNLRSWLCCIEAELSRPITYSVCHHHEIQRRLAEHQELQRDIEQHTEGVVSVLSLCDVLLHDEDASGGGGSDVESDSLQETSRSLDQRWRTICAMALERKLRIEETWRLWCKFLDDYSRFEDWLKMAERTAANPNSGNVLYTVAKEELKKFESFQRQVHERLTQLELVNNQYRRLARENRTDRASQLKAMVHEGNRRWDALHHRVAAILRRLKYFTSQREEFEGTRESMLVWLTELDLQLTNVEHFSESDVHHKIQQLNSFQKEIALNTERIDGLIVFGEGLIQKSAPQDAAQIEEEVEELHSYCQEVFRRLVRFHQRLSQPPVTTDEPDFSSTTFSLESSLELIGRPWLGRGFRSLPATPSHLLTSPLERSGRETPVSVDSLPLEWDHTGDLGGSSSHEDDGEGDGPEEDRVYFSALSVPSRSLSVHDAVRWQTPEDAESESSQLEAEGLQPLTSTPLKQGYLRLMSHYSDSIEDVKRISLILDDEEPMEDLGLTGLTASDKQPGVIERWELLRARSRSDSVQTQRPKSLTADLDDVASWLEKTIPELRRLQLSDPVAGINMDDMAARAKDLKEMQRMFTYYKSTMLSVNLRAPEVLEQRDRMAAVNRAWTQACTDLQQWDASLRKTLMRCQEFHETLHSLLLWLANAESRRGAVDISHPATPAQALQHHRSNLTELREELQEKQAQQASLQALWAQLQPEDEGEDSNEAREKIHVTGSKLRLLLRQVNQDLSSLRQHQDLSSAAPVQGQSAPAKVALSKRGLPNRSGSGDSSPPQSFFHRFLRAALPLHLLLLLVLVLPCLVSMLESDPGCTEANNFARSFYPMLRYTNGPPPT